MRSGGKVVGALIVVSALAGCSSTSDSGPYDKNYARLSGQIIPAQGASLAPDSVVYVTLANVSRADVDDVVIADQLISQPGQLPVPFEIRYNPDAINPAHKYVVEARVSEGGVLSYVSNGEYAVLTQGGATEGVEVVVEGVNREAREEQNAPALGPMWRPPGAFTIPDF